MLMKYVFGFLVGIVAIVIMIVLIVSDPGSNKKTITKPSITLTDYVDATDGVRFTTSGPIIANEEFQQVKLTITPKNRTIEIVQGYSGKVIDVTVLPNTTDAYNAFIGALNGSGYVLVSKKADKAGEESTACATGKRYAYQVLNEGSEVNRLWSTSCGIGTFGGNNSQVRSLFEKQFPEYKKLTEKVTI